MFWDQNRKFIATIFIVLLCFPLLTMAKSIRLTSVRLLTEHDQTRLVIEANSRFQYKLFTPAKNHLGVSLWNVALGNALSRLSIKNSVVKKVRSYNKPGRLQLVFSLKEKRFPVYYLRHTKKSKKYQLVIRLVSLHKKTDQVIKNKELIVPVKTRHPVMHDAVVVIDPGHGGKDPGASGALGTHEKDVVLSIGKTLYDLLQKAPHVHPILTRRGDYFVPLRERLALARQAHADLFIAIHADAYKTSSSHGASVFALSERGATSEAARWLAESENASELVMAGIDLSDQDSIVRSVLLNLAQTATIRDSLVYGECEVQALRKITRLHVNHVEQAPFVVLKSPDIPSLLVETGFISNRKEELKLRNPAYRRRIATALRDGIVDYLNHRSSYTVEVSPKSKPQVAQKHIVRRKETLMALSRRYHVSVQALRQANHLKTDRLFVGQALVVPQ